MLDFVQVGWTRAARPSTRAEVRRAGGPRNAELTASTVVILAAIVGACDIEPSDPRDEAESSAMVETADDTASDPYLGWECNDTPSVDYNEIYHTVFEPSCGTMDGDCHATMKNNGAKQDGLAFGDESTSYRVLVQSYRDYVVPGDAAESLVAQRITSDDPQRRMPQLGYLSDEQICLVLQWIADGAPE